MYDVEGSIRKGERLGWQRLRVKSHHEGMVVNSGK